MEILVTVKMVRDPESSEKLRVSPKGDQIVTTGVDWRMNPFDECALEAALRLTEDGSNPRVRTGQVIVVSVGPVETEPKLRNALALGAVRVVRVDSEDQLVDGHMVSAVLARIVRQVGPDLVIMGKQTVDFENGQVGQALAQELDWPIATSVSTILGAKDYIQVRREVDTGTVDLKLSLPAIVTVDLGITAPSAVRSQHTPDGFLYSDEVRFAPLPAIAAARRKSIETYQLHELVGEMRPKTRWVRYREVAARPTGRKVGSVEELVGLLGNEAKVV